MLLSSIQIQGFKSFADKTVLKFGKGITAVVGPNGSGKSNISDAVRWVLGEQSTKSLRGQSMEDVIFGGTDTRRPHGFCEVTLNIDNSDRSLNFDSDSVSVTRRYYRSHESDYLINNVSVRLKDIHELFMDTGLGRDGYSMIGQGKIDNIISSKSDERRDIFEEASGISKYRYRKTEAEKKLAAAEDNLLRLRDIMDELESRVGPLCEQSEKAEKFLDLSENKKKLEIGLWVHMLNNSKDALRLQENKISAAQLQYDEAGQNLDDFEAEIEANTAEFANLTALIEQERSSIALDNENILKLDGEITVTNNNIEHNKELIKRLSDEKSQLLSGDNDTVSKINEAETQAELKSQDITLHKSNLDNLQEELTSLITDSEGISGQIETKIKALNSLSAESSESRVRMVTCDTSVEEIAARLSDIDSSVLKAQNDTEALANELKDTSNLLNENTEKITSLSNSLKGYELRLQSRRETLEKLKTQSEEMRLDIEAKRRKLQILCDLEKNMEGFSHAVKFISSESKKGTLRNICGTVSDLISVDKKYSVAIETALGNNIQNIIVETEADAKRCINLLKKSNAGRATFLPIDSIKAKDFKDGEFDTENGYIGIASDLVNFDGRYTEIVKSLLGGTVVTEDIDTAVTLAKNNGYRVKIVTLDGQTVNPGGSLTGGSLVKQAGLLSRKNDINKLNEEIQSLEKSIDEINEKLAAASEAFAKTEADITAVKSELTTANEDKIMILSEIKRIEELKSAADSNIAGLLEEKHDCDSKVAALKEASSDAAKQIARIESEKAAVQLELDKMTDGRNAISDERERLSEKITSLKLLIISDEKDRDAFLNTVISLKNSMSDRKKRGEEIDAEIADINTKNEMFASDISAADGQKNTLLSKIAGRNREIDNLMLKRNETEKSGVKLRSDERELSLQRERIGGELARLSERKEVMVAEYDDIIRKLYDEYQLTKTEAEARCAGVVNPNEAKKELADIKSKIRSLGNVNVSAIEEYKEVKERFDFMKAQIEDVEASRKELHRIINQLTAQMQELFVSGFDKINANFSKTFSALFGGGQAVLKLTDPENILESGIDIEARLPGKNVPSLDGLSGGEKALVALSIYFAIMDVNPPPFCFLDEVDTALDDINVDRFADFMKESGFPTQFICVTHRRGTMEAADMLYGVTMQEKGVTKLLELNVDELEKKFIDNKGA